MTDANDNADNLWRQRNELGETKAVILEGWNAAEDVPVLTQTLSGLTAGTVGFSELTGYSNSDRRGLRGYLGTAIADPTGEIKIYADDDGFLDTIQERVWFDGASYEAIPEPATFGIMALFGGAILFFRNRMR